MDTVGRVKLHSPAWRKLPCFNSKFSFEMKRKLISLPLLLVSPPPCSLSMSPKVDEEQSDSAIPSTALSESDSVLVHVRFVLQKECMFGERFYLVGDDPLFGLWDPINGIPLDWSDDHIWSAQLDVPICKKVEFKFVLVGLSGEVQWQPGPNRILLLDQVMTSTNPQASTIIVWEDWDSAGNQTISLEDDVRVSTEATVMQDEIQAHGRDQTNKKDEIEVHCPDQTNKKDEIEVHRPDQTNKTSDNSESTQEDANSGIISKNRLEGSEPDRESHSEGMSLVPEPDRESHSEGMPLVPGLNPPTTFPQENYLIKHLETADGDGSPPNEMTLDDCDERSYNNRREEPSISSEEVNLETTTAGILRNDLRWGQRALEDSTTASVLRNDLQWGRKALHDFISGLGFDFDKT